MAARVLGSVALSSLANPGRNHYRHTAMRVALRSPARRGHPVLIPSADLVELYRVPRFDEPVDRVLAQGFIRVVTTGALIARHAGHLLARVGRGGEFGGRCAGCGNDDPIRGGLVLTDDPTDRALLSSDWPAVKVV